jgi:hypothetical protein
MNFRVVLGFVGCVALAVAQSEQVPHLPMVPPAGPGVFTVKPAGPATFKLVVTGHEFTSRGEIEKYLAYRAARHTVDQGGTWFTFTEDRAKGETAVPVPARDPEGQRFSFRMKYFRPVWRYKVSNAAAWARWSPFSGEPFPSADPKTITDFEVSATIVVRKGPMDDADPLAYEAWALSDLLVNQVSPPK